VARVPYLHIVPSAATCDQTPPHEQNKGGLFRFSASFETVFDSYILT
jgi:hypothetical protein